MGEWVRWWGGGWVSEWADFALILTTPLWRVGKNCRLNSQYPSAYLLLYTRRLNSQYTSAYLLIYTRRLNSQYPSAYLLIFTRRLNSKYPSFLRFTTFCSAHRSPIILESSLFEIYDILFCVQESQNSWKFSFWNLWRSVLRPGVPEILIVQFFFKDFRRVVLHTGVPYVMKVQLLNCLTFCSAHRSPTIYERACLIFLMFCSAHKSPITYDNTFWDFWRFVLRTGVP